MKKKDLNIHYTKRYQNEGNPEDFSRELAYSDGFNTGWSVYRKEVLAKIKEQKCNIFGNFNKETLLYILERMGKE